VTVIILVLIVVGIFAFVAHLTLISDEELVQRFREHKPDFERLRDMFLEDKVFARIGGDFVWAANPSSNPWEDHKTLGITDERMDEYHRLFAKIKCPKGIGGTSNYVFFCADSWGFAGKGPRKEFVWTTEKPKLIVPSLNQWKPPRSSPYGERVSAYRYIEDNWYLSLSW
jgi:hypothetical protein